jgi:DNA polymerase-3 subunit delta
MLGGVSQIHVIVGTDEGTVSEEALKVFNQFKPEGGDEFSTEIIDGVAANADEAHTTCSLAIQALQTLPFFGGGKTIWLKNVNFLGTDRTSKAEATKAGAEALLTCLKDGLPQDVHLIISCSTFNKARSLCKFLAQSGDFQTFDKMDASRDGWQEKMMPVVRKLANGYGLNFKQDALLLFVTLVGVDTRQIQVELEKMDIYLGDRREVSLEDVRVMVPLSHAGVIFEIGHAIQKKDGARALELVNQQLARKESAVGIIRAAIIPTVRNLFMAAAVGDGRKIPLGNYNSYAAALNAIPERERAWLPQKKAGGGVNAYPLFLASQSATRFSLPKLRNAMRACLDADRCLVTSGLEDRTVLHRLIVTICS